MSSRAIHGRPPLLPSFGGGGLEMGETGETFLLKRKQQGGRKGRRAKVADSKRPFTKEWKQNWREGGREGVHKKEGSSNSEEETSVVVDRIRFNHPFTRPAFRCFLLLLSFITLKLCFFYSSFILSRSMIGLLFMQFVVYFCPCSSCWGQNLQDSCVVSGT